MGPLGKQQENERKGWTEPGLYTLAGFADIVKSGKKKIFFGERCFDNSRDRQKSSSLEKKKRYVSNEPGPGQYSPKVFSVNVIPENKSAPAFGLSGSRYMKEKVINVIVGISIVIHLI